jgi:hypothetical protein
MLLPIEFMYESGPVYEIYLLLFMKRSVHAFNWK